MDRKIGFLGIVLLFIVALGGFYFYLKSQQSQTTSAYKAVPINAALIFDIHNPKAFVQEVVYKNRIWQELIDFKEIEPFQKKRVGFNLPENLNLFYRFCSNLIIA